MDTWASEEANRLQSEIEDRAVSDAVTAAALKGFALDPKDQVLRLGIAAGIHACVHTYDERGFLVEH